MNIVERVAKLNARLIVCWLALLCAWAIPLSAQSSPAPAPVLGADSTNDSLGRMHGDLELDGPWRFQVGDDPDGRLGWADPGFDDSAWPIIKLSKPIAEQGFDSYTGYGWYRLHLQAQQLSQFNHLPDNPPLDLLVTGDSIGQLDVYVNGVASDHTRGMTDHPVMYVSPPLVVRISNPRADGSIVLAIRSWAGPGVSIRRGLLAKVELGFADDIADKLIAARDRHWNEQEIAGMIVSFLFLCVATLGLTLYLAQRHHSEYLWLALLCLSVAVTGGAEFAFRQALIPYAVFSVLILWLGRVFMAVTLEFVLRFTGGENRKLVRAVQAFVLLVPFVSVLHQQQAYEYLSICAEVAFTALVSVLLFRAWRRGRIEAAVMLAPFFLASTADSIDTILDYSAGKHWIPERFASHHFFLGPIEFNASIVNYIVFLASLLAVILYRFVHVSLEEQRSVAEIEAARSVQAMLIPTQLPSNHNFMLESAYLPANGVGGDFFQVLPLKDDSMLIVVGDVSGKGLQAAMNASTLVGALRNELSHDPATVLNRLNNVLLGATSESGGGLDARLSQKAVASFATCLCARIYPDGTMAIANAGHLHPYRDGRELELAADLPLGVIPNIQYEQATFKLKVGDRLIFLSDGVVEASNPHGELFGFERTQQVSNESARYIAQTAKRFGQSDDITVVSLYFAASNAHKVPRKEPQEV
jgi:sigma-B regulation protein RsbU (phosphoserine phosphatase)